MPTRRPAPASLACFVLATLSLAGSDAAAAETGRWRLPSNVAQFCGVGYGPGYHAPIVRSPGSETLEVRRLYFVPKECEPFGCSDFRPMYASIPGQCRGCQPVDPYVGYGTPSRAVTAPQQHIETLPAGAPTTPTKQDSSASSNLGGWWWR